MVRGVERSDPAFQECCHSYQ